MKKALAFCLICIEVLGCSSQYGYIRSNKIEVEITPDCILKRIEKPPISNYVYYCPGVGDEIIVNPRENDSNNKRNTLFWIVGSATAMFVILLVIGIAAGKYDGPDDIRQ